MRVEWELGDFARKRQATLREAGTTRQKSCMDLLRSRDKCQLDPDCRNLE